jgi:hypothetical protein
VSAVSPSVTDLHADQEGDCASGTGRPDFAGQLSWTCWCRWLQHTAGTEYIASRIQFALKIGKLHGLLFMSIDNAMCTRTQPPDEAVTLPTDTAADGRGPAADGVVHRYQEVQRRADC